MIVPDAGSAALAAPANAPLPPTTVVTPNSRRPFTQSGMVSPVAGTWKTAR